MQYSLLEKTARQHRLREAMKLQEIESNPLDAEDVAMFEMFEREGYTPEQRRAYITTAAREAALAPDAAE